MTSFPPIVQVIDPIPFSVVVVPDVDFTRKRRALSNGLVTQQLVNDTECLLTLVGGYNSDVAPGSTSYVQLHDTNVPLVGGEIPIVIIPVSGGKISYSYGIETLFSIGIVIAMSTTELTFTAPASDLLFFNMIYYIA